MKNFKIFLCIFFTLNFILCKSQETVIELKIKIIDEEELGIPEARLVIYNSYTTINLTSDLEGNITIEEFKIGKYQFNLSALWCYAMNDFPIEISKNNTMIKIVMKNLEIDEPVVVKWEGGWATLEKKNGKIISVRVEGLD